MPTDNSSSGSAKKQKTRKTAHMPIAFQVGRLIVGLTPREILLYIGTNILLIYFFVLIRRRPRFRSPMCEQKRKTRRKPTQKALELICTVHVCMYIRKGVVAITHRSCPDAEGVGLVGRPRKRVRLQFHRLSHPNPSHRSRNGERDGDEQQANVWSIIPRNVPRGGAGAGGGGRGVKAVDKIKSGGERERESENDVAFVPMNFSHSVPRRELESSEQFN